MLETICVLIKLAVRKKISICSQKWTLACLKIMWITSYSLTNRKHTHTHTHTHTHIRIKFGINLWHINKCPGYDINSADGEPPVLEIWRMWSIPSLPLLPRPLWPGLVVPVMVLSMVQTEPFNYLLDLKLFNGVQTNFLYWIELLVLDKNTWNHLTMCKQMGSDLFKNKFTYKQFTYKSYNTYV